MKRTIKRAMPLAIVAMALVPALAQAQIVSNSGARPGAASGAAVDMPGLLIVNKSSTSSDDAKVTALNVGGAEFLGYQDGKYRGVLAPAAAALDPVNKGLCPNGAADTTKPCIVVLHMNTSERNVEGQKINSASATLLGINSPGEGLNVAGSAAASQQNSTQCADLGAGYLLVTKSGFKPTTPNSLLFTQASSINKACPTPPPAP